MASDRRFFFDMTNGGQASGRNMLIGVQFAGRDITIRGQRASRDMTIGGQLSGRDLTIGGQLSGRDLTIGSQPDVQPAGRMTEGCFDKVVGAIAVVVGIIFGSLKAVVVADCDQLS